ncbi:MAG: tetratricopeptide repeat protein, partial [Planctomycetota bacterium]
YENNNWLEAAKNLGRYISIDQANPDILFKYADAQLNIRPLKRSNIQQAIATYRTVLRIDKNNFKAAESLINLYLQMDINAEAELIAERYIQTNSDKNISTMLAIAMAKQRKFRQAADLLEKIVREHPDQIAAYEILGTMAFQRPQDFQEPPLYWFDEAVSKNPNSAHACIIRGSFYMKTNKSSAAIVDLLQAEKMDLSDLTVRLRLARELANANLFDKTINHLREIKKQDPRNLTLWKTWAQIALKKSSSEEMLNVANSALNELAAQPWDFLPIATELFIRSEDFPAARDCIKKLKRTEIAPDEVAFLEGLLAEAEKQDHKAIQSWKKALQLGGESVKNKFALAAAFERTGDIQSAILQLRSLASEHPDLFAVHLKLARLLSKTGNFTKAAEQTHLAIQIKPDSFYAAFLNIQARLRLSQETPDKQKTQIWQEIEDQLNKLEELTNGAFQVKLLRLRLAMQRKQFAFAHHLLESLNANDRQRIEVALVEIELLTLQGNIDQAISKLYLLSQQFPENILPVTYFASLLASQRQTENCEKLLKKAIASVQSHTEKRELGILLAQFYYQWQKDDKAYGLLTELARQMPYDIPIKRQLLRCPQITKNTKEAQQIVNAIKDIEGEDGWQWRIEQANIWLNGESFNSNYSQFVVLLKENLRKNPADQESRMLLAAAYERAGELDSAIATYRQALDYSPEDITIIIPTIEALYKAQKYDSADEILKTVTGKELAHPQLFKLQLQSSLRQGKFASAENILQDLIVKDPNNKTLALSLALVEIQQNKFAMAHQRLKQLTVRYPDSLPTTAALIELHVREGQHTQALELCDRMVGRLASAAAHLLRARTYLSLGKEEPADRDIDQAITIEPNNVGAWVLKSRFHRSQARFGEAIEAMDKALTLDADNLHITKQAILLLLRAAEPDYIKRGIKLLEKSLSENPHDIELRLYKARTLLTKGTMSAIEQAQTILQKITEERPKTTSAWVTLAQIYLDQGQKAEAMSTILRALTYSPEDRDLLFLKAETEAATAPALAVPTLKALNERLGNDTEIALALANIYVQIGRYREAITLLNNHITHCSEAQYEKVNTALAVALYKNGSNDKAEQLFDELYQTTKTSSDVFLTQVALLADDLNWSSLSDRISDWSDRNPNDVNTLVTLAAKLAVAENVSAARFAENLLRTILKHNPDSTAAIFTLAMLMQAAGRTTEADALYRRLLQFQPENVIAINNLAWIMCEEQGNYQQALELAKQGLRKTPDYVDLIDTCGVIYYRLGDHEKAVTDFTRCIELCPGNSPALVASYFHLARALVAVGHNNGAADNLQKALDLSSNIGGLSPIEVAEAKNLLGKISEGTKHGPI